MDKSKETQSNELPQLPSGFEWGVEVVNRTDENGFKFDFIFSPKLIREGW